MLLIRIVHESSPCNDPDLDGTVTEQTHIHPFLIVPLYFSRCIFFNNLCIFEIETTFSWTNAEFEIDVVKKFIHITTANYTKWLQKGLFVVYVLRRHQSGDVT